jgi:hypothetical protein
MITLPQNAEPDILRVQIPAREVIRIAPDGRIFWNGREVETDDQFRAAMLELRDAMLRNFN